MNRVLIRSYWKECLGGFLYYMAMLFARELSR